MARAHYENFPVASRLLPAAMRPHVAAVYAFARIADDLADEGTAPPDTRQESLRRWQQSLHQAVNESVTDRSQETRDELVVIALAHSIRSRALPVALFD